MVFFFFLLFKNSFLLFFISFLLDAYALNQNKTDIQLFRQTDLAGTLFAKGMQVWKRGKGRKNRRMEIGRLIFFLLSLSFFRTF